MSRFDFGSRRAQVIPLLIVIAAIALLGTGAYVLSQGFGSEITGFAPFYPDGCNGSITDSGNYQLETSLDCVGGTGINISADDVTLDCGSNTIDGTGKFGINISGASNVRIENCEISGFVNAILVESAGATVEGIYLTENVLTSTNHDLRFTAPTGSISGTNVWHNNFRGGGVDGTEDISSGASFCNESAGNFYKDGAAIPSGECSQINITCPNLGSAWLEDWSTTIGVVDDGFNGQGDIDVGDLDGDGDVDIVATAHLAGDVVWWKNIGEGEFTPYALNTSFNTPYDVIVEDLDEDGDLDVIAAGNDADQIAWWENSGTGTFTQHLVSTFTNAYGLDVGDLDNDGDIDIAGTGAGSHYVSWFENDGSESFTRHDINNSFSNAVGILVADFDGDGRNDIVASANGGTEVAWWENIGYNNFTQHSINASYDGASYLAKGDLDGDGDIDFVASKSLTTGVFWFENELAAFGNFTQHAINDSMGGAQRVSVADMDNDGDLDVLTTDDTEGEIVWWVNQGERNFTSRPIDLNFDNAWAVVAGNLEGDDLLEVVGLSTSSPDNLAFWSITPAHPSYSTDRCPQSALVLGNPPTSIDSYTFYNVSEMNVSWMPQSGVSDIEMNYYLRYNDGSGWTTAQVYDPDLDEYYDLVVPAEYMTIDVSDYVERTLVTFRVIPNDGYVNGSADTTQYFNFTSDADGDGASSHFIYSGGYTLPSGEIIYWDCDDQDTTIHQPDWRENRTNPYTADACYNAQDDDCDHGIGDSFGGIDWLDYDCGDGFAVGSFYPDLYINGSISDLSATPRALIENAHGRVEMLSTLNLLGEDLTDYFAISHNRIEGVDGSLFDEEARITFKGLTEYAKMPVVLVDEGSGDIICNPDTCYNYDPPYGPLADSFSGTLSFTASGFSTYSTTSNSRLEIFTQAEPQAAGISPGLFPEPVETYHRVRFYANYTIYPDGESINNETVEWADVDHGGNCNITIFYPNNTAIPGSANARMRYDAYHGVYWYETGIRNFTSPSAYYDYNITCNSILYEPLNAADDVSVEEDTTPPAEPVLFPQVRIHNGSLSDEMWTWVVGYFGESDISYTVTALHENRTYQWGANASTTDTYSEFRGDEDLVVNYSTSEGDNVTFIYWNAEALAALAYFRFAEFSNHDRMFFRRYYIANYTRIGDPIRLEFNETLEADVFRDSTRVRLFDTALPPGYFKINISLFSGDNMISVWGDDRAGNSGNASEDWISAPYPESAPAAPELWDLPDAVKFDPSVISILGVIGRTNETALGNLNTTVNFVQGFDFNLTWDNTSYSHTYIASEAGVTDYTPPGTNFFYISDLDYDVIGTAHNFSTLWVSFSNHNRTFWRHYNVTNTTDYPGEDARIYIDPPLEVGVESPVLATFHNDSLLHGWFNISVEYAWLWPGMNRLYSVPFRNGFMFPIEGYPSVSQYVYRDSTRPAFNLTGVPTYTNTRTPTFTFNVSDDYVVNISSLLVNVSNSTHRYYYAEDSSAFPGLPVIKNISCTPYYLGNASLYTCSFDLNRTQNGTYSVNFSVTDLAGWDNWTAITLYVEPTTIDILRVSDYDDIQNELWLYANWTYSPVGGELDQFEFTIGDAPYGDPGREEFKPWTSLCWLGNCTNNSVNITHVGVESLVTNSTMKFMTGTVYYFTVRARNLALDYGDSASSDGVLFIDPTPPRFINITDGGAWTNSLNSLYANWTFEDNESDIVGYMYAIGNVSYPHPGFNNIVDVTEVGGDHPYALEADLSLTEHQAYYFSVKARNGNIDIKYNGTWSAWKVSDGITVDVTPPRGGSIFYNGTDYVTTKYVTIQYNTGYDPTPNASGIMRGSIVSGRSQLIDGYCQPIQDLDYVSYDVVAGPSFFDFNVSSGYCYAFRLDVWDNAGNIAQFNMLNDSLEVVPIDYTPPSDISWVYDDGFYTFDRKQLHARWDTSEDNESGLLYYQWEIYEDSTADPDDCNITATSVNCSRVFSGTSTNPEYTLTGIDLTHNYKYYWAITPKDRAGLNGTRAWSNGIIYIDNSPPAALSVYWLNEANESSSPYLTRVNDGRINITLYGDLDGYTDIHKCMLLSSDIDYLENTSYPSVLSECRINDSYQSNTTQFTLDLTEGDVRNITEVFCSNVTNYAGGPLEQGIFTWYVSCRDIWYNTQSFAQNTPVEFEVDWHEAPLINITVQGMRGGTLLGDADVFSNDSVYCQADIADPEDNLNSTNITFVWYFGEHTITRYKSGVSIPGTAAYRATDTLTSGYTARGYNVTCQVNASDTTEVTLWNPVVPLENSTNGSVMIRNAEPFDLLMVSPNAETVNNNMSFWWLGPYDDADGDFITLEIQVDNETSKWNVSNNADLSFTYPVEVTVEGIEMPGTQRDPDIYRNRLVYADDRSGNWDIYMYNFDDGTETSIAVSTLNQYNPQIYGDYVFYEQELPGQENRTVMRYTISTAVKTRLIDVVQNETMDAFGAYIAYNDGYGVRMFDIISGGQEINVSDGLTLDRIKVYGTNVIWADVANDARVYDHVNYSTWQTGHNMGVTGSAEFFGPFFAYTDNVNIDVVDMRNGSTIMSRSGGNISLYGNKLVYCGGGAGIIVEDLLRPNTAGSSQVLYPANSSGIAIYDQRIVFEHDDDLYYSTQNLEFPAYFLTEDRVDGINAYTVNTNSSEDQTYKWRIWGCDSSYENNSCVIGWNSTDRVDPDRTNFTYFNVDNGPPEFSSISPAAGSIEAGEFRVHAKIVDMPGGAAFPDYVTYANYSIIYRNNNSVRVSGELNHSSGSTTWSSGFISFLDINVSNFTLTLYAKDFMDNWNSVSINFTINNNTPWFLFGTGDEEITVDGLKVFDDSDIESNFTAFTVLTSTLRIVGPLPLTTTRFIEQKVNTTITNHDYSDDISTHTWPDGKYRVEFTGTNLDGTRQKNRTFYIDRKYPVWSNPAHFPVNATAAVPLVLSIRWNDTTLAEYNFTYDNLDLGVDSATENHTPDMASGAIPIPSGQFNSSGLRVWAYINRNFTWNATARDMTGRVNRTSDTTQFWVFVESDPPVFSGSIASISVNEDYWTADNLPNVSERFSDPNMDPLTAGTHADKDNLTFSAVYNATILDITINETTGMVLNVTAKNDFYGNATIRFNATDYYNKTATSHNVTVVVAPQPDAPRLGGFPLYNITEDSPTPLVVQLVPYTWEVDGENYTWLEPLFHSSSVFRFNSSRSNLSNGTMVFDLFENAYGLHNITFRAEDITGRIGLANATVNITPVNDPPTPGEFIAPTPDPGDYVRGTINISWSRATDNETDDASVRYHLSFTNDSGVTWYTIADYTTLVANLSYGWDSTVLVPANATVTVKLNVTDGENSTNITRGPFTVDNEAPIISVSIPTRIIVGTTVDTLISTHEPADCILAINNSPSYLNDTSTSGLAHVVEISGVSFNRTYELNVTCTDDADNSATALQLFEPRANALEFITAYATPPWAYVGGDVNITLEVASNNTLNDIELNITAPDGTNVTLDETQFHPEINAGNKVAHLNVSGVLTTSVIGSYDLYVQVLGNTDGESLSSTIFVPDIYEVFRAVNHTWIFP